jgi:hypothetical protein
VKYSRCLILLLALAAYACTPATDQDSEELETVPPTATFTPTPTIVWFPPSATPTSLPTQLVIPTAERRPAVGEVLLQDPFEQTGEHWDTYQSNAGSAILGKDELTLVINQPKTLLLSLRDEPILNDFYLEMTTEASLCRSSDSYGLILRAAGANNQYRFALNCSGQLRLERVINGKMIPISDWVYSGQVPPGSPLIVRIGIWAARDELRFFINDFYQFGVRDPVFRNGQVGVFARSGGNTAVSVSFSNLTVRSVDTSQVPTPMPPTATRRPGKPTRTPTATPTPRPTFGPTPIQTGG